MDSKNELVEFETPKKDQLIPKIEPIEVDFIKKEKIEEEEYFSVPVESFEVDKDSVKKEEFDIDEIDSSSSNVWKKLICP